jgi:hypothetical protein
MDQFSQFYAYLNNRGGLYTDYATQLQEAMQRMWHHYLRYILIWIAFLPKLDSNRESNIYEQESFKKQVFPVLLDSKVYQQNKDKVNIVKFHPVEVARQVVSIFILIYYFHCFAFVYY